MPLLSKWTEHTGRWKTDEKPRSAILFPLYNKAFKLLADSNIHLFCLGMSGWGESDRWTHIKCCLGQKPILRKLLFGLDSRMFTDAQFPICPWLIVDSLPPAELYLCLFGMQLLRSKHENVSAYNRLHLFSCVHLSTHSYSGVCFCLCMCLCNWLGISGSIQEELTSDLLNK